MLKLQGMDKSVKCAYSFICRPWIKCKSSQVSKQTLNRQTNKQINRIGPPTRNLEIKTHWTSFKMPAQTVSVARDCLLMMLLVFRTWKANEVCIIANFLLLLYFYIFLFQIKFLEHFWENSPTIFNFDFTTYWKKIRRTRQASKLLWVATIDNGCRRENVARTPELMPACDKKIS